MKPQDADTSWYSVWGIQELDQFTEDILAHTHAGNYLEIGFHNLMKGVKWQSAAPFGESVIKCCTGTISKMGVVGDSDIFITLKPNDCPELMVETNNGELECELPWQDRDPFVTQLLNIEKGGKVKICGYWTRDYGHPWFWQSKNELHDITDIVPL